MSSVAEPVGGGAPPAVRRSVRAADALPGWTGSIRVRLTLLYSVFLFALAGLVLGGVYLAQARTLETEPISRDFNVTRLEPAPGGQIFIEQDTVRGVIRGLEQEINDRALAELRQWSLTAMGVLFLASLGVGWIVAGRVLRPIGEITDVARDIQAGDLSRRIALGGPADELRELADTFDDMLGRLDEAFDSQRRFIQEASHELRNPLAVMRTNLEVTLADEAATPAELRQTAEVVRRTSERMSVTVDNLLAFARHEPPAVEHEPVDLCRVASEVAEEFGPAARAAGVAVVAPGPGAGPMVEGDEAALRQAVANLVDNATRASPPGATVEVEAGTEGPWVWLAVTDEGHGIAADQHHLVFTRFWRGEPSAPPVGDDDEPGRGRRRGSGLGLPIVAQIADAHGGEVRLSSTPGHGSRFSLWLPAPP